MSFGWSAGDIATAVQVAFKIANALRKSGGSVDQRQKALSFLQTYQHAIQIVQEFYTLQIVDQTGTTVVKDPHLEPSLAALKDLYDKLRDRLDRYAKLHKEGNEDAVDFVGRQIQKLTWLFFSEQKVQEMRAQITGQIQILQPILILRQGQKASKQSASHHDEMLMNMEILKEQVRLQSMQIAKLLPLVGPEAGVASMEQAPPNTSPEAFTGYEDALTNISPYVQRVMTDDTSIALRKLKGDYKLTEGLRKWLLDSDENEKNCLWLLTPSAIKLSAIMYSVGRQSQVPVLAYACRQVDESGEDIATRTLFTQLLYAFLDALLSYLHASKEAEQRIDACGFAELNGEFSSAAQAITLLGNLLDNAPSACICIIDNFQRLDVDDDPQVTSLLKDFLGLFKQEPSRIYSNFQGRHKLLVTTRGLTGLLVDMTEEEDMERLKTDDHIDKGRYLIWEELKTASDASK